ncbi:MAG: hypothetical protein Q8P31_07960 [Bacillota bacterium]|nr:hypothetical protein [Bacillota bacterium]
MAPLMQAMRTLRRYPLLVGLPVGLAVAQGFLTILIDPRSPRSYLQWLFLLAAPFTASGVNVLVRNGVRRGPVRVDAFVANLGTFALPIAMAIALILGAGILLELLSGLFGMGSGGNPLAVLLSAFLPALTHVWLATLVVEHAPVMQTMARSWVFLRSNAVPLAPLLLASLLLDRVAKAVLTLPAVGGENAQAVLSGAVITAATILLRTAVFHVADRGTRAWV